MSDGRLPDGLSLTNPIRQLYMIGTIWRLSQDRADTKLRLLEVGAWNGGSTLMWGEAVKRFCPHGGHITCVDAWEAYFDTAANARPVYRAMNGVLDDGSVYAQFQANMALMPDAIELEVRRGYSQDILPNLPRAGYDMVYLDGDHTYSGIRRDIENALDLVRDGGVLCGDDLEIQACQIGAKLSLADAAIDLAQLPDTANTDFHPGVTLAVDEIFGPVSCWEGFWAMRKNGTKWEKLNLEGMPLVIPPYLTDHQIVTLHEYLTRETQ